LAGEGPGLAEADHELPVSVHQDDLIVWIKLMPQLARGCDAPEPPAQD
jgi:hypothetical protein